MQKTPFTHASRIFSAIFTALALLVLTGCNITITNLTPDTVPQNPSQIYTITARFHPDSARQAWALTLEFLATYMTG